MSSIKSFIDDLERFIESGKVKLPPFQPNAMRIQQELVKEEPSMTVVEQTIIRDQALASEVLRIANSAYYRGLSEVKTVKAAVVRLGMQEVGRIVLLAATRNRFASKDKIINRVSVRLWQHSAGCGLAANWLAKRCNYEEFSGSAFFAGLLHDIGKLFIFTAVEQANLRASGKMTWSLLMEVADTLHTKEGYRLMKRWNMPEQYAEIVRDHHLKEVDAKNPLLLIVRMADLACNKLSIGISPTPDLNLAATAEASYLELSELDVAELEIMLEDTKVLVQ